jgi:hypothetical protein
MNFMSVFFYRIESVNVFVLPRFDLCHVLSSSTNNFADALTFSRMSSLSGRMTIARVYIGLFTGLKKIKQRRISYVWDYEKFRLETKIMNFMSGFFLKKNIIKSTQVLSIIGNTICLQFSLYRSPWIRQCFCSPTIRFVPCAHFIHQQTISHMLNRFPRMLNIGCFILIAVEIFHNIIRK